MPSEAVTATAVATTPSVVIEDVAVSYAVYEDVRPTLRRALFGGGGRRVIRTVEALKGVSATVQAGEVVGVIGPNGAGKSTLLKCMAGLLPPTSGRVLATSTPTLLAVGAALRADLSGRRNIVLGGTALGIPRKVLDERMDEMVAFAGLQEAIDRPLRTYSSGMGARLNFTIAAYAEPQIMLIDEALAVGDRAFRNRSFERMRQLTEHAGTVFIVSHSMKTVREWCTRVLWIQDGRLRQDGPPDEVVAAYEDAVDAG